MIDNFQPVLGNSFTILETLIGNVSGTFDIESIPVFNDLTLDVVYNPQSVVLQVIEAGDFDGDRDRDGADFLTWQREDGTAEGLAAWENNYGNSAPSLASSIVPEPTNLVMVLIAIGTSFAGQRLRPKRT